MGVGDPKDPGDAILVEEDYCVVCHGKCTSKDPEDYEHLYADWDRFVDRWMESGVGASTAWAFLASVLMDVAHANDMTWSDIEELLKQAWDAGTKGDGQ